MGEVSGQAAAASSPSHRKPSLRAVEEAFVDDGVETDTSVQQTEVEEAVGAKYLRLLSHGEDQALAAAPIFRSAHKRFLRRGLVQLPSGFSSLDASRPWLCYWIMHALDLLGDPIVGEQAEAMVVFLKACVNTKTGGFGGGPMQMAHLAPSYAAVNALCILATESARELLAGIRQSCYTWMRSLRQADGSMVMHIDGEVDVRATYCAASIFTLLNLKCFDEAAQSEGLVPVFDGATAFLGRCQTYEGGIAALPGMEAHGGYTFCGLAAAALLGAPEVIDLPRVLNWAAHQQTRLEGGFRGRTNKLVDGCYSWWQGGAFKVFRHERLFAPSSPVDEQPTLFDSQCLQEWLLLCCQEIRGGLVDKPGKSPDYYHSCYCLSGLSAAQDEGPVMGDVGNRLVRTHALHNIRATAVEWAKKAFAS